MWRSLFNSSGTRLSLCRRVALLQKLWRMVREGHAGCRHQPEFVQEGVEVGVERPRQVVLAWLLDVLLLPYPTIGTCPAPCPDRPETVLLP